MQTRQVIALVTVVAVVAFALGTTIAYSLSSESTTTVTQTGKTSTMTNSYGTLFPQSTTYTTVSQTTLSFGGSTYATTTGEYSGCIPPVQCYLTTVTTVNYLSTPPPNSTSTSSGSSHTSTNFNIVRGFRNFRNFRNHYRHQYYCRRRYLRLSNLHQLQRRSVASSLLGSKLFWNPKQHQWKPDRFRKLLYMDNVLCVGLSRIYPLCECNRNAERFSTPV